MSDDPAFDYDPRVRPWYINAVEAKRAVFSMPYLTILNAEHSDVEVISCSVPYYDAEGIAGVASMDMATEKLRRYIHDTAIGEKGVNFVLSNEGRIKTQDCGKVSCRSWPRLLAKWPMGKVV